jgi:multimeric flavodoxin WrbA
VPAVSCRRLLIVWWSNTGGTAALVTAAADGAAQSAASLAAQASEGTSDLAVLTCRCDTVSAAAVLRADALLFATPECLGSMAGPMKTFFDRCYYPVLDGRIGRPYATIVCAGSDGYGTIRQIERIATGWRLKRIADPLRVITGAQTSDAILAPKAIDASCLAQAAELGATLAAGTLLGIW